METAHLFIKHLPMGYAHHKLIYNELGQPVDYEFLAVNPAYEIMAGLKEEHVIGKRESQVFFQDPAETFDWVKIFGEVASSGQSTTFTQYSIALGRWLRMTVYSPAPGEFITLFQDVTDEKKMNQDLQEALQFNREIIHHANNGIIVYDKDLKYRVYNPYMEQQTGVVAASIIGRHPWEVFPESKTNGVLDYLHQALNGESVADVELHFYNSGEKKDICSLQSFSPLKNARGEVTGVIVTVQDITEKKKVYNEWHQLNHFMKLTLEHLPIGVALNSITTGKTLYMNKQFENTYGWPREKLVDTEMFFQQVYQDPEHRKQIRDQITEDIDSGDLSRMRWDNVAITTEKGETRYISAANIPVTDQNIMVSTVWDVTHLKTHELELQQAKERAEAANLAKSQFLANMSHEIRTPMNGFMGMLQLMETTRLDQEQQELLELAKRSSEALLRVLNDILDFSRIEANKVILYKTVFQPRELIADIIGLFKGSALDKKVHMDCNVALNIPHQLVGDSFRLRQVIANLLGNAIKFTQHGRVHLNAEMLPFGSGNNICLNITIEDTGIGIAPEELDLIFDRFVQSDSSDSRLYGGTGLGLAISKGLVQLMGGKISAVSQVGKGSVFSFTCYLEKVEEKETTDEIPSDKH